MRQTLIVLFITLTAGVFGQRNGLYKFRSEKGSYGFIDAQGRVKIQPKFLMVDDFQEGLCFVSIKMRKGGFKRICIDTLGNEVFKLNGGFPLCGFSEGFARMTDFEKEWFVNRKGENEFRKTWKESFLEFKKGITYVSDSDIDDFYPIDITGKRIGNETYSRLEVFELLKTQNGENQISKNDNLVAFEKGEQWGFRDTNGNEVIKPIYYAVSGFANGICAVRIECIEFEFMGGYFDAIINTHNEIVNRVRMYCYNGFNGDLIEYYLGPHFSGGPHYLNREGQCVIPEK